MRYRPSAKKVVSFDWNEVEGLLVKLAKFGPGLTKEAAIELDRLADIIMGESIMEVPVDTGALRRSAFRTGADSYKTHIEVQMGYGGPNDQQNWRSKQMASEYAAIVHEDTETQHMTGKAKFLEDPMYRHGYKMVRILGDAIRMTWDNL